MKKKFPFVACLAAAALIIPIGPAAAGSTPPEPDILAENLVSPLSLAVKKDGSVLVTQDFVGLLSRVDENGSVSTVYQNAKEGWGVAGVETRGGKTYFVESVGAGGGDPAGLEGYLKSIDWSGDVHTLANLAKYERTHNPDGGQHYGFGSAVTPECLSQITVPYPPAQYTGAIDSNPYATAVSDDTVYVADAGSNAILEVNTETGKISTLAVLPPRPAEVTAEAASAAGFPSCVVGQDYAFEPVPTDVEVGPDGWLYVSSLPGGPEDPSLGARGAIFKINPWTGATHLWADDILSPTGLGVGDDGDVYVASMFGNEIIKVNAWNGKKSQFLAVDGPAAVELRDDNLYATVNAIGDLTGPPAATGKVIEVDIR